MERALNMAIALLVVVAGIAVTGYSYYVWTHRTQPTRQLYYNQRAYYV